MKTLITILIAFMILSAGCTVKRSISTEITHDSVSVERDSIHYEYVEVVRDSLIFVPADSAMITAYLECDSLGVVRVKYIDELEAGLRVKPSIKIVDNYITVECIVDSNSIYIMWKDRYEREYIESGTSVTVEDTLVVKEKVVKKFIPLWVWILGVVLLALAAWFIVKKFKIL